MAALHRTKTHGGRGTTGRIPSPHESGIRLRAEGTERTSSAPAHPRVMQTVATSLYSAACGLEICARRAHLLATSERIASLAAEARLVADRASERVPGGVRRPMMSERLRWEWIASTAAALDGAAEERLLDEVSRHLAVAVDAGAIVSHRAVLSCLAGRVVAEIDAARDRRHA